MAIAYATATRHNRMQQVVTDIGTSGLIKIYDATGGTPAINTAISTQVLLVTLTCSSTFGTDTAGVLTAGLITAGTAVANGTAAFFRITTSGGTAVVQGTVGTSGTDLVLSSTAIKTGSIVSVSSLVLTEGNA